MKSKDIVTIPSVIDKHLGMCSVSFSPKLYV